MFYPQISPPIKYQDGLATSYTCTHPKIYVNIGPNDRVRVPIIKSTVFVRSQAVDRGNNILIVFVGTGTSKFGRNCIKLTSKTTISLSAPSRSSLVELNALRVVSFAGKASRVCNEVTKKVSPAPKRVF